MCHSFRWLCISGWPSIWLSWLTWVEHHLTHPMVDQVSKEPKRTSLGSLGHWQSHCLDPQGWGEDWDSPGPTKFGPVKVQCPGCLCMSQVAHSHGSCSNTTTTPPHHQSQTQTSFYCVQRKFPKWSNTVHSTTGQLVVHQGLQSHLSPLWDPKAPLLQELNPPVLTCPCPK